MHLFATACIFAAGSLFLVFLGMTGRVRTDSALVGSTLSAVAAALIMASL